MKATNAHLKIFLFSVLIQACGLNTSVAVTTETVVPNISQVLDFTDILDISDLHLENIELDQLPGRYISEQGGAVVYLNITLQEKGGWIVGRMYTEPGRQNISKQYRVYKTEFGLSDRKGDIFLRKTREGLIVFEKNAELETIPNDYWIHYIHLPKG